MPIISLSYYSTLQISENGLSISAISCMHSKSIIPWEYIFKVIVLDGFGIARGL